VWRFKKLNMVCASCSRVAASARVCALAGSEIGVGGGLPAAWRDGDESMTTTTTTSSARMLAAAHAAPGLAAPAPSPRGAGRRRGLDIIPDAISRDFKVANGDAIVGGHFFLFFFFSFFASGGKLCFY